MAAGCAKLDRSVMLSLNFGMPSADRLTCSAGRVPVVPERIRPCRRRQRTERGMFDQGAATGGKAPEATPAELAGGGPRGSWRVAPRGVQCVATGNLARPGPAGIIQPGRRTSWITAGARTPAQASARTPAQASTRIPAPADTRIPVPADTGIPAPANTGIPAQASARMPVPAGVRASAEARARSPVPASIGIPEPANTRALEPAGTRVSGPARVSVLASIPISVPGSPASPRARGRHGPDESFSTHSTPRRRPMEPGRRRRPSRAGSRASQIATKSPTRRGDGELAMR